MNERYMKLFSGEENLYEETAPLVIRANALLKDTKTGKLIAQLKFQNMSGKTITYVKAKITPLDAMKQPLENAVTFEYADLAANDKETFGSKTPIFLSHPSTRAFLVGICAVGFSDDTFWTSDTAVWHAASDDTDIRRRLAAEDTYSKAMVLSRAKNIFTVEKAIKLFESIADMRDVSIELRFCQENIDNLNRQVVENEKQRQARKKRITVISLIAGGCVLLFLLGYFVLYPWISVLTGNYRVYIDMYNIEEYEVAEGVTEIKEEAFSDCKTLKTVILPDSVTSIDACAFMGCTNLESVTMPKECSYLGIGAFYRCSKLKEVTIPNGITQINDSTFYGCTSLTSVTIPEGITSIGHFAFDACENITSVTIPDSVGFIGCDAFPDHYKQKAINIYYNGSKEQWDAVSKHFNYKENIFTYYYASDIE